MFGNIEVKRNFKTSNIVYIVLIKIIDFVVNAVQYLIYQVF